MPSIPPILQSVVTANLTTLLLWFSQEMYQRLWSRAQSHFLVRLRDHLDLGPLEAACADYVSVATTDTCVREIQADTGSQPDPVAIPDLLTSQQEHHDLIPEKFMDDMAAGTGKWHAEVARVSNGQTQLVAPLVAYDKRTECFGLDF